MVLIIGFLFERVLVCKRKSDEKCNVKLNNCLPYQTNFIKERKEK